MNINLLQRNLLLCNTDPRLPIAHPDVSSVSIRNGENLSIQKLGHHCPFSSNYVAYK